MADREGVLPTVRFSSYSWAFVRWWVDRGAAGCAVLNGRFVWNPCGTAAFCRSTEWDWRARPTARWPPVLRKSWQWWQGARPSVTRLPDRRGGSRAFGGLYEVPDSSGIKHTLWLRFAAPAQGNTGPSLVPDPASRCPSDLFISIQNRLQPCNFRSNLTASHGRIQTTIQDKWTSA